jgi:tetratricopeptide (TPR) repeat protein
MLHQDLQRGDYVALSGIGGIGKSELAAQYVKQHQNDYGGITWFNSRENLAGEVLGFFSIQLGLEIPQELRGKQLTLEEQINWCWSKYPDSPLPILIIFDDVTDLLHLRQVLPAENPCFRILITTRLQNLDPNFIQQIPVEVLAPEPALELLQKLLGNKDKRVQTEPEAATNIIKFLEYLPLGIILVAGYLLQDPGLTLTTMLARLRERKLAEEALQNRETINKTQLGIRAAFSLTWSELNPQAQLLGAFLSLFSPQSILWELVVFTIIFEADDEEKRLNWTEEKLNELKKQLYQRNLIQQIEATEEFYKIHALVELFLQEKLTETGEMQPVLERTFITPIIHLASQLPQTPTSQDIAWFKNVISHLEELGKQVTEAVQHRTTASVTLPTSILTDEIIWIYVAIGRFYQGKTLYQLAEFWYQNWVNVCQFLFKKDHPDIADSLNNLAVLYYKQGKYSKAEPLFLQALEMTKRLFIKDHPDVATSLNNLALFYQSQGKYNKAELLYFQALEMRKRLFTNDHPDVATSLNNLAGIYDKQGKYNKAEFLYVQALEMKKRLFTNDHPDVASSLNNLATIYDKQGKYNEAELLYVQALEMRKRLFTNDHPDVALSLNNLAFLYENQGKYNEAESLYVQALEIRKRLFTNDHPDVASSLNNLAGLYDSQGKYSQAELLYFQALEITKRLFTNDHPDVASSLNNLAELYRSQGKYTEAESLYLQALEMRKRLFTNDHPDVANSLNNLALLYKSQGKYSEVEPLYLQALEMRKRLFTKDHPDVANSLNNLAGFYQNQGKYTEAELLYLQALDICERVLGVEHPTTIIVRNNLRSLQQQRQPIYILMRWLGDLLILLILPFYLLWLIIKSIFIFCLRLFRH